MIPQPQPRIPPVHSQSETDNFLTHRVTRLAPSTIDPVRKSIRRLLPIVRIPGLQDKGLYRLR
jgi:hypothetical protein